MFVAVVKGKDKGNVIIMISVNLVNLMWVQANVYNIAYLMEGKTKYKNGILQNLIQKFLVDIVFD